MFILLENEKADYALRYRKKKVSDGALRVPNPPVINDTPFIPSQTSITSRE
jgi:hypothetical protein